MSSICGPSTHMTPEEEQLMRSNIELMNELTGFDVVVVCCSNEKQAEFWMGRLEKGKGSVVHNDTVVLAVFEDWPGGAGNALGTLYAYQNAAKLAKSMHNLHLDALLSEGKISIGLYHTAGKGTRLAPLPGGENNNKPGVKIPAMVNLQGKEVPVTILESVIKQTGSYAPQRKGRLSVFWGDQVFIPTASCSVPPKYHADILCSLGPMMSEKEWKEKGMDKYGLIAQSVTGAAQVEKVDHATAVELLTSLGEIVSVGASLGSFSLSSKLLAALMTEYASELAARKGKLDSDPHLWMPMTLTKSAYLHLMQQKDTCSEEASEQYARMEKMVAAFKADTSTASLGLFGPVDVGQDVLWWDYGQLPLYQKNTLRLTEDNAESKLMKLFYGIKPRESIGGVDDASIVCGSTISGGEGKVVRSVVINVYANHIEAEDSVLINVTATRIIAPRGCILYNVIDTSEEGIVLTENEVRVGVFSEDKPPLIMRSSTTIDGGKNWEKKVLTNPLSFEEVYNANGSADTSLLEQIKEQQHEAARSSLFPARRGSMKRPISEMEGVTSSE